MKASELVESWTSHDNKRLTSKQVSIRLPVHIAARVFGLCDMFPNKTRTDIVADLLNSSLEELEKTFSHHYSEDQEIDVIGGMAIYPDIGSYGRYANFVNKHHAELEKELGNDYPSNLLSDSIVRPVKPRNEEDDY